MASSVHRWDAVRIYNKEACSIATEHEVEALATGMQEKLLYLRSDRPSKEDAPELQGLFSRDVHYKSLWESIQLLRQPTESDALTVPEASNY